MEEYKIYRQLVLACTLILGLVLVIEPSVGDDGVTDHGFSRRVFVGLWQAIDSLDGSTQLLSITCSHTTVEFDRRGQDARLDEYKSSVGRRGGKMKEANCDVRLNDTLFTLSCPNQIGFAQGNGRIHGNVLTVDLTLTCGSMTVSQLNEFVYDRKNGTLTNLNDDPSVPNVFHRISR